MSTLSGVSSKGEKGKSKFQSLDINSLYHKTNKGESSEQQQTKSTVPRKHGMQSLGKVPSTRRAPVNLPSLKSEHSGSDPTVSLVPTGGTGWGSKPSDAPPITSTPPVTTSGPTQVTNAPAVVGTAPVPQTNITPTPPQPPKPVPVASIGGDKTWSSVMVGAGESGGPPNTGGGSGPSFLAHQSPQFQAEFPSLPGEGGVPGPPQPPRPGEGVYGPGPSLRPQTEGSWAQGGGYSVAPPTSTPSAQVPRPFLPPLPTVAPPSVVPQYKGIVPSFMLNRPGGGAGFTNMFPGNFQNSIRPPKMHNVSDNRYNSGSRPPQMSDPDELMARPIIREEDLNRMDEISRDSGWGATQDDIDYNQKLAFSDDEGLGNDDDKEIKGKSSINQNRDEKKDHETEKENREKSGGMDKMMDKPNLGWHGRNQPLPQQEFRSPLTRLPHSNAAREMEIDDVWKEKRRQQSEQVAAVTEKAKQRKEEEEKRFEETRSKSETEKKKKEDDMEIDDKKDQGETFRQLTQLENRNFSRNESQQSHRYHQSTVPPRFQKQQQQYMRQGQQQNLSETRWNNQHYPGNKQRLRGDSDEGKEKDGEESGRRERNTPEPSDRFRSGGNRPDRDYDMNKKSGSYDKKPDTHRGYQHDFKENKESDSRTRERENEMDWEGRRGGSVWDGPRNVEDKTSGRRDNKKIHENYNKPHPVLNDRDGEWREQRNENRERPVRPDSRDSRASRESRTSREEPRTIQESVSNDYSWADPDFEKDIHEDKHRRKETYKEDRRETQTHFHVQARREGHVPGPITRAKMEAYEHKQIMAEVIKAEKKEIINSSSEPRGNEEDSWKKSDIGGNGSWSETSEDRLQEQQKQGQTQAQLSSTLHNPQKLIPLQSKLESSLIGSNLGDESNEKVNKEDIGLGDKKIVQSGPMGGGPGIMKDKGTGGNRGTGRNNMRQNMRQQNPYFSGGGGFYRGQHNSWIANKDSAPPPRRGPPKSGKAWNASESEGSADEVSASTESGKEDKKTDRKQTPRSPKVGDRKKDKDDRNRDSKKTESINKAVESGNSGGGGGRKPMSSGQLQGQQMGGGFGQGSGGGFEGSGGQKEGFQPRGEPSRRGRGAYRIQGGRGPVGAHYGPPGSKPAFPSQLTSNKDEDPNDSSSEDKKKPVITGRKDQRKSDSDSSRSNKGKGLKPKREQEEWETTSEGSDSETKGKSRTNKKLLHRPDDESRNVFSSGQMNGRPRSEDNKPAGEKRLPKEDEDPSSRFTNHSDLFHSNNGFQEVRSKKTAGKDSRPVGKDDLKRGRGGKEKGKVGGPPGGNGKPMGPQGKAYTIRDYNNKPPRMQRQMMLQQQQLQSQQADASISDMNKLNQNISIFPIRDVSCPAPAPPPSVNAWDKPITAALRTTPPPANLHHLPPAIPPPQEKNVIELNDHGPSGTNSQTGSPSAEKTLSKIGRETVEKAFLDGATPPVQTIVFENTKLKAPNDVPINKYPLKGQRIEKGRDRKLDEELKDTTHMGLGGFKPGSEIKPTENKSQEPIQMPMSFSKNEDTADMKLDFQFESDLSHLTEDKPNIPRSIHQVLVQNSDADLNQKIASVKKVWDTAGSMMEHQHHDEVVSTSSSSFTPNFGTGVDTPLDHSHQITPDDNTFTSDVYTTGTQIQGGTPGYTNSGGNMMKTDPSNHNSNVCKRVEDTLPLRCSNRAPIDMFSPPVSQKGKLALTVKPQPQQAVISSAIGTHSGQNLASPPPPFNQQGHFGYQTPYNNMPAIPSPPAVIINSGPGAGAQQVPPNHQPEAQLYHSFPINPPPTMISSGAARSGYSQYPYGLGQGLGSTSGYNQGNLYLQQPNPPNPSDVFPSLSQFRIQPSATAYGQSQQLSNSPSTVLITSSSNSLMSASAKTSAQPPLGAIGSKAGYQSSAHPSQQVQLSYIQYDPTSMLPQNFLQSSPLVPRHGGSNVVPAIQPTTSYYSSSTGGQNTGLFQPGSSILAGAGSQPGALHNATAFGMQGFGGQSAAQAQPTPSNPVGVQSYSSQMSHFQRQGGAGGSPYLKAGGNPGQHSADPSKSPSTNQDLVNSVFSGGGQIPSPKSRAAGAGGKQPHPPQQPSPTQPPPHHKFSTYQTQPNLVMQNSGRGPAMQQGVRTLASNGNGLSNNGVNRYPTPIQRPVVNYQGIPQQGRHRVPPRPQPSHQQHLKISSQYYQHQVSGSSVKLDVEGKEGDGRVSEVSNPAKVEKKEEQASGTDQ